MNDYSRDPSRIVVRHETCPIPCKDGGLCGKPVIDAPFPICERHVMTLHLWEARQAEQTERLPRETMAAFRSAALDDQSVVYYVRLPGDRIKIGTTVNLATRLGGLRVKADALLATEPGSYDLEKVRHKQFASDRIGRIEDFRPSETLMSHIDMLRAHYGEPTVTRDIVFDRF